MTLDGKLIREFMDLEEKLRRKSDAVSLYDGFGVKPNATEDELRSQFRKKAQQYHPDSNTPNKPADAEDRFKLINNIYEILSNPEKRAAYDAWLKIKLGERAQPSHGGWQGTGTRQTRQQQYANSRATGQSFSDPDLEARVNAWAENRISTKDMMYGLSPEQVDRLDEVIVAYFYKKTEAESSRFKRNMEDMEKQFDQSIKDILRQYGR